MRCGTYCKNNPAIKLANYYKGGKIMKPLIACPFCGAIETNHPLELGPVTCHELDKHGQMEFWVLCESCGVTTKRVPIEDIADAMWNTRMHPYDKIPDLRIHLKN
jgi:hypothetical protein